ncbi:Uncharacterised protein [Mycobacterium tuberculosis]|nr:Uncharacterised protein [Mycobacterium tuberculosis]CKV55405.1 Uncharacterised protein [Mycobacterium tuberculosis]
MNGPVAGVRVVTQIMNSGLVSTEVVGDLASKSRLLAQQEVGIDADTCDVLDGVQLQVRPPPQLC